MSVSEAAQPHHCHHHHLYLVISNISKRKNVCALLQAAVAFGCKGIFVVGLPHFDLEKDLPGILKRQFASINNDEESMPFIQHFDKWNMLTDHLKQHKIFLVGVEIHERSVLINEFTLTHQDTALLMGNEGQGLNEKQLASCDAFVRIPQYGGGTASLNVYVAACIVLHELHYQAK